MFRLPTLLLVAASGMATAATMPVTAIMPTGQLAEQVRPERKRARHAAPARHRYRSKNAAHRRRLKANRLHISRRTKRRHRRAR